MTQLFSDAAMRAFAFLESAGFRLVSSQESELRYESTGVLLGVSWDRRSGELDAFIGLRKKNSIQEDAFSLTDILRMQSAESSESKIPFQVADESHLGPFLQRLAENVQTHAQPALAGDRMFFRRLDAFRGTQAQALSDDMNLRRVRSQVKEAWHRQELGRVIDLYASIENHLTPSEKKKLDYAKRNLRA